MAQPGVRGPLAQAARTHVEANQLGDLERCALRSGNVHSAAGWREVLEPGSPATVALLKRCYFRGDAAFATRRYTVPRTEGMGYAIRLPANRVLQDKIGYLLKPRAGDRRRRCAATMPAFATRPAYGTKPRCQVEWHPVKLYPRVGFIVTTWRGRWKRLVAFYNHRGTCEQYIKEGRARSMDPAVMPILRANAVRSSSTRWPTISAISCGRWRCRRRRSRGH